MSIPRNTEGLTLSPHHERILRELVVDEDGPGTILHDFEALLTFVSERDLRITGMHQLPLRALGEINARMANPIELGLKRPVQKSYPHINGLYLLLRASGLTHVKGTPKKPLLAIDSEVHQTWMSLNPTERYCTLLETWLLRGYPEIIGESDSPLGFTGGNFVGGYSFFRSIPDEGIQAAEDQAAIESLRYYPMWHNVGLLELFGLISIQPGPLEAGKGWCVERIDRTPAGIALFALLQIQFFADPGNLLTLASEGTLLGTLQPILQPYFPNWKRNLAMPIWSFREGTYTFLVTLWKDVWRRIRIPAEELLDTLATEILDAVGFDDRDHLYEFSYDDRFGTTQRINHPYMDEGPWTSEVQVGAVPLGINHTMTFLFDFGDRWEFDITLERVDPDVKIQDTIVLESSGESPVQYPTWDEDEV